MRVSIDALDCGEDIKKKDECFFFCLTNFGKEIRVFYMGYIQKRLRIYNVPVN